MFLTQDEIETLTGYVKHKKQREWLAKNGYSFKVACSGRPIVSRTHSESQLSGSASAQPAKWEPNFDALKKVA